MDHLQQLASVWGIVVGIGAVVAFAVGLSWRVSGHGKRLDDHKSRITALEAHKEAQGKELAGRLARIETTQEIHGQVLSKMDGKLDQIMQDGCSRAREVHGK